MKELVEKIKSLNIIKTGSITLRSGKKSNFYIDMKKAYRDPEFLLIACRNLHKIVHKDATYVAGMGIGGIPLATTYSVIYQLPLTLLRPESKKHGINQQIEAYVPTKIDKGVILDDVFTIGSSIKDSMKILKKTESQIIEVCVILKRGENNLELPVKSILTLEDLIT